MNQNKRKLLFLPQDTKMAEEAGLKIWLTPLKGILNAEILAVVSNHENGGVREMTDRLGIKFYSLYRTKNSRKIPRNCKRR